MVSIVGCRMEMWMICCAWSGISKAYLAVNGAHDCGWGSAGCSLCVVKINGL